MSTPDTDYDESQEQGTVNQEQSQQDNSDYDEGQEGQQEQKASAPPAQTSVLQRATETVAAKNTGSDEELDDIPAPDELTVLKQRATMMGIKFSNNIGVAALRAKIVEKMEGKGTEVEGSQATPLLEDPNAKPEVVKLSVRTYLQRENMKLIRLRITNLDPKKKDLPGEILTVANEYIGTVRKFVPYGDQTENGFHVPNCIYKMMKRRKFQNIRNVKIPGAVGGNNFRTETSWVSEFSLEVLPPLTREEIAKLAANQHASNAVG